MNKQCDGCKEAAWVIAELRQKLASAGVEGSPPPGAMGTIPTLLKRAQSAEHELEKLRNALREAAKGSSSEERFGERVTELVLPLLPE